jgi:hypothetical protein
MDSEDFTWNAQFDKDALVVKIKALYKKYSKIANPHEAKILSALLSIGMHYLGTGDLVFLINLEPN